MDRRRRVGLVLDFGFSERRPAVDAPVDGLLALVHHALLDERAERADDRRLVPVVHRQVGLGPEAEHAETLELLALDPHVLVGVPAAGPTKIRDAHVALFRPELAVDLQLNRQAVTIPSRHVRGVVAGHRARADDEILQNLVECVADVDVPVRIRRAVVQHELRTARAVLPNLSVQIHVSPSRQPFRFGGLQVRLHRKTCSRQVDGVLPLGHTCLLDGSD